MAYALLCMTFPVLPSFFGEMNHKAQNYNNRTFTAIDTRA